MRRHPGRHVRGTCAVRRNAEHAGTCPAYTAEATHDAAAEVGPDLGVIVDVQVHARDGRRGGPHRRRQLRRRRERCLHTCRYVRQGDEDREPDYISALSQIANIFDAVPTTTYALITIYSVRSLCRASRMPAEMRRT